MAFDVAGCLTYNVTTNETVYRTVYDWVTTNYTEIEYNNVSSTIYSNVTEEVNKTRWSTMVNESLLTVNGTNGTNNTTAVNLTYNFTYNVTVNVTVVISTIVTNLVASNVTRLTEP